MLTLRRHATTEQTPADTDILFACLPQLSGRRECIYKGRHAMKPLSILTGDKFGQLTVIEEVTSRVQPSGKVVRRLSCRCECGRLTTVTLTHLSTGHSTSCGCWRREAGRRNGKATGTHRKTGTPTFNSWESMRARCSNPLSAHYAIYGGRGIRVCQRWSDSFQAFLDDMGERPAGTTIDRIDNSGNYEPGNCRWATPTEQARNKRNNVVLEFDDKSLCVPEWAERTGLPQHVIRSRLRRGWTVPETLSAALNSRPSINRIDVPVGERFGRLIVVKEAPIRINNNGKVKRYFVLHCDCGNEATVALSGLRHGGTSSCGCLQREWASQSKKSGRKLQ